MFKVGDKVILKKLFGPGRAGWREWMEYYSNYTHTIVKDEDGSLRVYRKPETPSSSGGFLCDKDLEEYFERYRITCKREFVPNGNDVFNIKK